MTISQAVALRILELIKIKKMSQYRLEQKAGISHETLKSIMKGKAKGVNLKTLIFIAEGLNMNISEFLNCDLFNYNNLSLD